MTLLGATPPEVVAICVCAIGLFALYRILEALDKAYEERDW